MTTLAIIGSGILGRSLIYTLAKEQKSFEKVTLFHSNKFAFPCTLHSTAISARRGVTKGHSVLGDMIVDGYEFFSEHVRRDCPDGIQQIVQYTGATSKLEMFKTRFPEVTPRKDFLRDEALLAVEDAFMLDTKTYGDWLLNEAKKMLGSKLEVIEDFVTELTEAERIHLTTMSRRNMAFDKVVFAGGNYNRFWKGLAPGTDLESSKPVQGSYLEFNELEWAESSFSFTLDGDNIIWNNPLRRLFVGSTTQDGHLNIPPMTELKAIYQRLSEKVTLDLPPMEHATVRIGIREKGKRRMPYSLRVGNKFFIGGLYKNAFTLTLKMTRTLSHQLL